MGRIKKCKIARVYRAWDDGTAGDPQSTPPPSFLFPSARLSALRPWRNLDPRPSKLLLFTGR